MSVNKNEIVITNIISLELLCLSKKGKEKKRKPSQSLRVLLQFLANLS
jgi:hypothetical protein